MLRVKTYTKIPKDIQLDITLLYEIASFKNSNYSEERLQEPVLGTTVVYDNDLLVGVSSILLRDCYNVPRIMNRYYYNDGSTGLIPKYFTVKIRGVTIDMIDQQVKLIKELGYPGCFTSRETFKGFERFFTAIRDTSDYKWLTDYDNKYLVNYKDAPSNWQWIMWTGDKYEHSEIKESRPADTEEILRWRNRPINTKRYKPDYHRRYWGIRGTRSVWYKRSSDRSS